MEPINNHFLEEYKRLDKLCKEIYRSEKGVSSYIDHMMSIGHANLPEWYTVLRRLKELRHVRNQLTHDVGTTGYPMCIEDDIEWIIDFHSRILNQTDPISLHRKASQHLNTAASNQTFTPTNPKELHKGCIAALMAGPTLFVILIIIIIWLLP